MQAVLCPVWYALLLVSYYHLWQVAQQAGCFGQIFAIFNNGIVYKFMPGMNLSAPEMVNPVIARWLEIVHKYITLPDMLQPHLWYW